MVSKVLGLGLRGLQFFWTLLIMALVGNMIATYNGGSPAIVNYDMFTAVFSMLSLFYLVAATLEYVDVPIVTMVLDLLNTLFFFIGGVATAAYLHVHSCNNRAYLDSNFITSGSKKLCQEGQASTAFLWFGFAAYVATTVFSFMNRGGVNLRGPGIGRGRPAMSQV